MNADLRMKGVVGIPCLGPREVVVSVGVVGMSGGGWSGVIVVLLVQFDLEQEQKDKYEQQNQKQLKLSCSAPASD